MNIRHWIIKRLAKKCCANCKNKGKEGKYFETYDNYKSSSMITGYQCPLHNYYLYEELSKCEKWQHEKVTGR